MTFKHVIENIEELRAIMGHPSELAVKKMQDHIDDNSRAFIEKSPFVVIGSSDAQNNFDISPKGDPPGFVKVLNKNLLAIPDRLGNRRADTFINIFDNPNVGLIFLIPGIKETLRVSGTAKIVADPEILALLAYKKRLPNLALIVEVKEAFMHCAKCMIRSKLWKSAQSDEKIIVPSLAKSIVDAGKLNKSIEEVDAIIKDDEVNELY